MAPSIYYFPVDNSVSRTCYGPLICGLRENVSVKDRAYVHVYVCVTYAGPGHCCALRWLLFLLTSPHLTADAACAASHLQPVPNCLR